MLLDKPVQFLAINDELDWRVSASLINGSAFAEGIVFDEALETSSWTGSRVRITTAAANIVGMVYVGGVG